MIVVNLLLCLQMYYCCAGILGGGLDSSSFISSDIPTSSSLDLASSSLCASASAVAPAVSMLNFFCREYIKFNIFLLRRFASLHICWIDHKLLSQTLVTCCRCCCLAKSFFAFIDTTAPDTARRCSPCGYLTGNLGVATSSQKFCGAPSIYCVVISFVCSPFFRLTSVHSLLSSSCLRRLVIVIVIVVVLNLLAIKSFQGSR